MHTDSPAVAFNGLSKTEALIHATSKATAPANHARIAHNAQSTKVGTVLATTGETRPITPTDQGAQGFLVGLVIGIVIAVIAWRASIYWAEHRRADQPQIPWIWIALAVICAAGHAFFVGTKSGNTWEPVFDTTTLLWLSAAALGFLYPRVSEITMGTFGVKLKDAVSDVSTLVTEALDITDKWATRLNDALLTFPTKAPAEVRDLVSVFLRDAARDAIDWFGKDGETRRLSYWLYAKDRDELGIYLSNEIKQEDKRSCRFPGERCEAA